MTNDKNHKMTSQELAEAVERLVERDQERDTQRRQRLRRREILHRKELEQTLSQMARSIEVIKWCIVGIVTTLVASLLVVIMVIMEVEREAERIKLEVQRIQRDAEGIRDRIRHPLENLGGTLGRRLDSDLGEMIGIPPAKRED